MWRVLKKKKKKKETHNAAVRGGVPRRGTCQMCLSQPIPRPFVTDVLTADWLPSLSDGHRIGTFCPKKTKQNKNQRPSFAYRQTERKEKKMTSRDFEKTHLDWQSNFRQSEETMSRPRLLHLRHGCHHSKNCAPKKFRNFSTSRRSRQVHTLVTMSTIILRQGSVTQFPTTEKLFADSTELFGAEPVNARLDWASVGHRLAHWEGNPAKSKWKGPPQHPKNDVVSRSPGHLVPDFFYRRLYFCFVFSSAWNLMEQAPAVKERTLQRTCVQCESLLESPACTFFVGFRSK